MQKFKVQILTTYCLVKCLWVKMFNYCKILSKYVYLKSNNNNNNHWLSDYIFNLIALKKNDVHKSYYNNT